MSSSRLPDPHTLGLGNLTMTQDFSLLGTAPNLAYYLGVSVISLIDARYCLILTIASWGFMHYAL